MSIIPAPLNREAWLLAALPSLVALLDQAGAPAFPTPLLSVGFPFGIRTGRGKAIGQCWTLTDQERAHIFVHPCLDDALQVLAVVAHELIHAAVGCHQGHRGPFATLARAIGLEGPLRATTAGAVLQARLVAIVGRVGPYPHLALDPVQLERSRKKQGTRQRKYTCPSCGQILRAATDDLQALCVPCSTAQGAPVLFNRAGGHSQPAETGDLGTAAQGEGGG